MKPDTKVRTNERYFNTFKRWVYGVVQPEPQPKLSNGTTMITIKVTHQEGETLSIYDDNYIMFADHHLEEDTNEGRNESPNP